jgi:hypothetical protein
MASNKFKIGEIVLYRPTSRRKQGPHGAYQVIRLLARPANSEPKYRIKNLNAGQERDARESELKAMQKDER